MGEDREVEEAAGAGQWCRGGGGLHLTHCHSGTTLYIYILYQNYRPRVIDGTVKSFRQVSEKEQSGTSW